MLDTAYEYLRPALPWKEVEIEGFRFDRRFKLIDIDPQTYESETRKLMREYLTPEDSLLVVGGGTGITAITASPHVSNVTAIEADAHTRERFVHHLNLNGVETVDVLLGWAGDADDPNRPDGVEVIQLNRHTAIEIDVEGNGIPVIDQIPETVRKVFYESHPTRGVPSIDAIEALGDVGFNIIDRRVEWDTSGNEIIFAVR